MLDRLYRILLRLLPRHYDAADRQEIWDTYQRRIAEAQQSGDAWGATRERGREVFDLFGSAVKVLGPAHLFDALRYDLRLGARSLVRSPLTTILATASLALGIGATTTIFTALDVWLIRPLQVSNADRLVSVRMANREKGWGFNPFSTPDFADWRRASETVDLAAYRFSSFNLGAGDRVERAEAIEVSVNLLDVLGIEPALGRDFSEDEGTSAGPRVVMLSHGLWESAFGADRALIGQTALLDGVPHTIVGVLPADRGIPGIEGDVWVPLRISGTERRADHVLRGVGLLRADASLALAREELGAVAARVALQDPERTFPDATVIPLRALVYGPQYEQGGILLGGAVLFVLLIACANIANLLLARGVSRTQEIAVRGALGAGRGRIVRQLLTESVLLAVVGGALGVVVAYVGIDLFVNYVLPGEAMPGGGQIALDGRSLTFTAMLTLISALVFGLLPALRSSRVDFRARLSDGGGAGVSAARSKLGSALVIGEISASLVLLILTGLMIRQLTVLYQLDMGMRTDDAVVFRLSVAPESRPTLDDVRVFYDQVIERLEAVPGVTSVATSTGHPLRAWSTMLYSVPEVDGPDEHGRNSAESRRVSPNYTEVMGLGLVAGRWFDPSTDGVGAPPVAVVSRALADLRWENPAEALGKTVLFNDIRREIVGVVAGGLLRGPLSPPPSIVFEPFAQRPERYAFVVVGHTVGHQQVVAQIRTIVRDMDPNLAVFGVQTLEDALDESLSGHRAALRILSVLGAVALLLTVVGVYGVMAHTVNRQKSELGLRMALGATAGALIRFVLKRSGQVAAIGLGLGIVLSLIAGKALSFLLVGVSPRDPLVLVAVSTLLFTAVLIASYVPARRAAHADPVSTLRGD